MLTHPCFNVAKPNFPLGHYLPRELYIGFQHRYMMNGVEALRTRFGSSPCAVKIVSAGYGLVDEDRRLVPYEATFQGKRPRWIQEQSNRLGIPTGLHKAVVGHDVVVFLLGKEYRLSAGIRRTPRQLA